MAGWEGDFISSPHPITPSSAQGRVVGVPEETTHWREFMAWLIFELIR
jgi:hypothetical protein